MLNAYEVRRNKKRLNRKFNPSILEAADRVLLEYENAWKDLCGRTPRTSYKNGWYYTPVGKYRKSDLVESIKAMQVQFHMKQVGDYCD